MKIVGRAPRVVSLLVVLGLCASARVPAQEPARAAGTAAEVDLLLQRYARCGFAGSVLVGKGGEVVLAEGYGLADRESGRRNTERTLFEIASITKQFTAAAILKLEQEGELSIGDPIGEHLPGVPASCAGITIHHLLTHTSGVPGRNTKGQGEDLGRAVQDFLGDGPTHAPGTHWEYWNGGYALLAGIVERVGGESYVEYCRTRLFEPAGMADTGFTGDDGLDPDGDRAAIGTSRSGPARTALAHPYGSYGYQYRGMGGAVTTVLDLWKWDRALRGDRVLGEAARQKLFEPVLHDYACGWFVTKSVHGTPRIQHGGGVRGFVSDLRRYPQGADDGCIAVLANADDVPVYVIADNLECLLFGKPLRHALPPELATLSPDELRAFAGEYQSPDGARLVVRADGDALSVGVEGQALIGELTTLRVAGSAPDLEASSRLAVEIVEAVARGDEAPLRAQMAPGIPPSWPGVVESKIWPEHARQHGALRSVKALGATARGDRVVVVLALDHEGTPSRVKIELDPAGLQILDWHGPEFPLALRLLPVGGGAFVEFGWQQTRRFEFVTADGEHGTDVVGLRVGERELARVPR